ncbi:MAG: hypothetical protein ACOC98_10470, partial [Thermodesulfobacteriota bacterium]
GSFAETSGNPYELSGVLQPGEAYVAASEASTYESVVGAAPNVVASLATINGNDAIGLFLKESDTLIDIFGEDGYPDGATLDLRTADANAIIEAAGALGE